MFNDFLIRLEIEFSCDVLGELRCGTRLLLELAQNFGRDETYDVRISRGNIVYNRLVGPLLP